MNIDNEKYWEVRRKTERYYKSIGAVYCPYFGEEVKFDSTGFKHLIYKSWGKKRSLGEQSYRFKLLYLVSEILSKSHTLQGYEERNMFVRQNINSRWEKVLKPVYYYIFIAIIEDIRIKVVVREISGEKMKFHSVYPFWSGRGYKKRFS